MSAGANSELFTPHIPLGISLESGLVILVALGYGVEEENEPVRFIRTETPLFRVGIYPVDGHVSAAWYDDPLGRDYADGRNEKVQRYLERYGALANWELRLDNGWNRYWFNPREGVALVYGIHKDVVRINQYRETHA